MEENISFPPPDLAFPKVPFGKKYRAKIGLVIAVLILAGAGFGVYHYFLKISMGPKWQDQPLGLVAGRVSQSARIVINLPQNVSLSADQAKDAIVFDPKVLGSWTQGTVAKQLIFQPEQKLDLGKYYHVSLVSGSISLAKDFQVVDDPKVDAIFPKDSSEAPETSAITIAFNRPMVPLTTLDQQMSANIPVKITPATAGKFKWITTRNLQFIPDKRLARSSNYTVSLSSGLVSMDGLPVPSAEGHFTTRPLRYQWPVIHHDGLTLYDEPVSIQFNQPVDLEKTLSLISVKNQTSNKEVAFMGEYGTRVVSLGNKGNQADYVDKSLIRVYQKKDQFGRDRFWDNKTNYLVEIKGAVPLEGDIKLNEDRTTQIAVPDLVSSVAADSPRSDLVEPSLFDPKGHLIITFYEDINKDASQFNGPGLTGVSYAQVCKVDSDGNQVMEGNDCAKEDNKKQLLFSFNESSLKPGQNFNLELAKIVNVKGLQLNNKSLQESVNVYPPLQIITTSPAQGERSASVTDLVICTNSPIVDAQPETFGQMLKSNVTVGKWTWLAPYKVDPNGYYNNEKCLAGQFDSHLGYGLHPETDYKLTLNLTDQFGQTINKDLSFTSGKIDSLQTGFNSLQKDYNVASPDKTKLTYAALNLDYVDLQVCQISAQTMLGYLNPDTRPPESIPSQQLNCQQTWEKRIDLLNKYWDLNYFQTDIKDIVPSPLGYYVLSFSNPNLRAQIYDQQTQKNRPGGQIYERTLLNITSLAAQEKKVEVADGGGIERSTERKLLSDSQGNLYWVTQIGSMDPVAGARVQVYQKTDKKYILSDSSQTDGSGIARAKAYNGDGAAIVTNGTDSTLVSSATDKFQWTSSSPGGDKTYIYSDRPIYRPSQQVFIKGLYRIGYDSVYEIFQGKPAHLEVFDSNNTSVFSKDLKISAQGTFNTEFDLPSDAKLGTYRVEALGGTYNFDVEEYKPAAFKLDLSTDKPEYITGDNFKLNIDANYYFGVPLEGGSVEYSLLSQDYYFDRYQDGNFQFGAGWYYNPDGGYGDNFIMRGKADIGSDGKASVTQNLDFNKMFSSDDQRKQSKIFVVRVTVKNTTGQSISGEQSFIVHRGEFYLGVNLQNNYFAKNQANKILIKSVDTQGKEKSVSGITGTVNKITWNYFKRQEVDGGYYYTSEKKLEKVQDISASTDGSGNYSQDFTVKDEGEYELDITAKDSRGNPVTASQDFYVYGSGTVDVQPLNNDSLDIAVQNSQVEVGQTADMVIKSPYNKAKALVAIESGRILDYQVVDVNSNFFEYSFPVKDTYAPNFYATVLLLSPGPEVKFGQTQFYVDAKEKTISVDVKPNKNHYLPGEEVVLDVTTKDSNGNAVSADVSLSVADLSVLALAGNPKKNPVSFFYDGRPLGVTTSSNIKNILQEAQIPTGTKGGSGSEPDDLAAKKRGVFKDTAYWNSDVFTDAGGHAQVKFTLPDNLTTWQIESLGITDSTKLGVGYQQFDAKKQLMVTPLVPRFVIPGDEFVVGGKIFNQTGSSQQLNITFESPSLEILDSKSQTVTLKAGETKTVYLKVRAPASQDSGEHKVTITAKNSDYVDSVDASFPVNPNQTYETVATSNSTKDATASEYVWLPKNVLPGKGGVQIKASATLAGVIPEALSYLVAYPYGCTEQMMSKIVAVATAKRFTQIKNLGDKFKLPDVQFDGKTYSADDVVSIGQSRIMQNQNTDGGFAYYPQMNSDFYLTLDVINALEQLKQAGYKIDQGAEDRAAAYVSQMFNSSQYLNSNNDTLIITAYTLSNVPSVLPAYNVLMARVLRLDQQVKYFNEDISNLSLTYLALLTSKNQSSPFFQKVFSTMENRVVIDGRGAYLTVGDSQGLWQYYETPVKDTALMIKAESNAKRSYLMMDKLLRWLQNSRSGDGSWGSTNNTVTVLDALVDYLKANPENLSNFNLELFLDNSSKGQFTFNSQSILGTLDAFVPVSAFAPDKLSELKFVKKNLNDQPNGYYYDMSLKYFLPVDGIAPRDEGFTVQRELYAYDDKTGQTPESSAKVGDVLRGHLTITVTKPRNFVAVESFIPAGMELVNFNLATEDQNLADQTNAPIDNSQQITSAPLSVPAPVVIARPGFFTRTWLWIRGWFVHKNTLSTASSAQGDLPDEVYSGNLTITDKLTPDSTEFHDDRIMLFNQQLNPGVYEYDYFVRALIPGKFQHLPATASELYTPENFGRSRGEYFIITQ